MTHDPPPVNVQRFRENMREAGVEEIVDEALGIFLREAGARVDRLAAAARGGDAGAVEMEAHALRSASLNIWAEKLARLLEVAESAGANDDVEGARLQLDAVRAELHRVEAFIKEELSRPA